MIIIECSCWWRIGAVYECVIYTFVWRCKPGGMKNQQERTYTLTDAASEMAYAKLVIYNGAFSHKVRLSNTLQLGILLVSYVYT